MTHLIVVNARTTLPGFAGMTYVLGEYKDCAAATFALAKYINGEIANSDGFSYPVSYVITPSEKYSDWLARGCRGGI